MEKNKRILKIGLVVISLSLIFSLAFAMITKLKNPVFLKVYSDSAYFNEDGIYSDVELILPYITDINDDRYITNIIFDEAPDLEILPSRDTFGIEFTYFYDNREYIYGRYKTKTIYVKLDLNSTKQNIEDLELNNVKIIFDNGDILNIDIGRIRFFEYDDEGEYFGGTSSGSSSDGTGYMRYEVLKDITLLNVESDLLDSLSDTIELKIEDIDYRKIANKEYKKGSSINMNFMRNYKNDIMSQYTSYNISPKLKFQDEDGNILNSRIREIRSNYYNFNFIDILRYLRGRGVI